MDSIEFISPDEWCDAFNAQPMLLLIAIAFVTHSSGRHFCNADCRAHIARRFALFLCIPYALHSYENTNFTDVVAAGDVFLRGLMLHLILLGIMLHIVPFVVWLHRHFSYRRKRLSQAWQEYRRGSTERRQAAEQQRFLREHPPAPPLPYPEYLRQQLASAEEQYHTEAALIQSTAVLDSTEREVALMHAKQRFLERLKGILG